MTLLFQLLLLKVNTLSPIVLITLFWGLRQKFLKLYFFSVVVFLLPLTKFLIVGYQNNFYNASIELVFYMIFIFGFTSFNEISKKLKTCVSDFKNNYFVFKLIIYALIFLNNFFVYPYGDLPYLFILIIEISKSLLLAIGLISNNESKSYLSFIPIFYIICELFINKMDNTSAIIYISSYYLSYLIIKLINSINFYIKQFKLKIKYIYYLLIIFSSFIFAVNFLGIDFLTNFFYKYIYVYDSIYLLIDNFNNFDLQSIYEILTTFRREDSVAARFSEAISIIINAGDGYFGSLVEAGSYSAILAHISIATIFFKHGFMNLISNILLYLITPISKKYNTVPRSYVMGLLPVFALGFNNQGDFITAIFLGFGFSAFKEIIFTNRRSKISNTKFLIET